MYHGLKYDAGGRCVEIPGQKTVPAAVRVRSYPVVEQKRWIWMGDADKADRTLKFHSCQAITPESERGIPSSGRLRWVS